MSTFKAKTMLTPIQIQNINNNLPYGQGLFSQPMGVPNEIKSIVIYTTYVTGGMKGGNYHGDEPHSFIREKEGNYFEVLDKVLEELCPDISYLNYKKIKSFVHTSNHETIEYYGNWSDNTVEYIILDELYKFLNNLRI